MSPARHGGRSPQGPAHQPRARRSGRRGRGWPGGHGWGPDLCRVVHTCPDTLAGARDKALVLTGFHYASRARDPAGLLLGDVALTPCCLVVSAFTGKTKHSVRDAKIDHQDDPEVCPVEAWTAYRTRLHRRCPAMLAGADSVRVRGRRPARRRHRRHGPEPVTRPIERISARAGVPLAWTNHSLRIGPATTARRKGRDAVAIADQGGRARHSRSMNGCFQRVDGREDNATAGLT